MIRYSKPLGGLLSFKEQFFVENDLKLSEFREIAKLYVAQPLRKSCMNCDFQSKLMVNLLKVFGSILCLRTMWTYKWSTSGHECFL